MVRRRPIALDRKLSQNRPIYALPKRYYGVRNTWWSWGFSFLWRAKKAPYSCKMILFRCKRNLQKAREDSTSRDPMAQPAIWASFGSEKKDSSSLSLDPNFFDSLSSSLVRGKFRRKCLLLPSFYRRTSEECLKGLKGERERERERNTSSLWMEALIFSLLSHS